MPSKQREVRLGKQWSCNWICLPAALAAFAITAAICKPASSTQDTSQPIWPTQEWQVSTPEEQGMDSKELIKLVDFGTQPILALSGAAPGSVLDSLLVVRHGKIVAEAYYAPFAAGMPHVLHSVTKAVISTLTAIAWRDGVLDNPSRRVLDFFDRHSIADFDERKEAITVQNLLDMTSGIEWSESLIQLTPGTTNEMERSPDWIKFILDRPMAATPGTTFNYSDGNPHLLSAILTKLTGTSALDYAKAKLFGPLGINDIYWPHDPQGISMGGDGLWLLPRDMAKIGYLYLRNGVWEGKQLLSPAWIDKVRHATVEIQPFLEPGLRYSNLFWALPDKHVYVADGKNSQLIMIFPDLDVVVVTTGEGWRPLGALADLVSDSVKSDTAIPANPADAKLLADRILDVSTEKPTQVGPASKLASTISGKVYRFLPNPIQIKTLSLMLTDPQPRYDIELYPIHQKEPAPRFAGPIGLGGRYRQGEPIYLQWLGTRAINAVKGSWLDDHTFVMNRLILGLGNPAQRWTFTFDGEKLNLRVTFPYGSEISIDGITGG